MLIKLLWLIGGFCAGAILLALTSSFVVELVISLLLVQWLSGDPENPRIIAIMFGWFLGIEVLGNQTFGLALLLGALLVVLATYLPKLLQFTAPLIQRALLLLVATIIFTLALTGFQTIIQEAGIITLAWLLATLVSSLIRQPQPANQGFNFR